MQKEKPVNIWGRLHYIDHRIVYIISAIACGAVMVSPLGLPLVIDSNVQLLFDELDAIPDGSLIHMDITAEPANIADIGYGSADIVTHLFQKNCKFIMTSGTGSMGSSATPFAYNAIVNWADTTGKEYGKDYVYLGLLGADVSAYQAFARDPRGFTQTDFFGSSLDNMEIMGLVQSYDDFYATVCSHTGPDFAAIVVPQYQKPFYTFTQVTQLRYYMPYHPELIDALAGGISQSAQYEQLLQRPGYGARAVDSQSIAAIIVIVFVIIGNIGYYLSGKQRRER